MKVTVIIPTIRPGVYLLECLKSLGRQDLSREDFETIVVLNGPRAGYETLVCRWAMDADLHVRTLYSQVAGVSAARNLGLDSAVGEYVAFVDDDDVVSTSYLSGLLDRARLGSIVASDVRTFVKDLDRQGMDYLSRAYARRVGVPYRGLVANRSFMSSACAKILPRAIIGRVRFCDNVRFGEDGLFMFEISRFVNEVVIGPPEAVYFRRVRSGSASRSMSTAARIEECYGVTIGYIRAYFRCPGAYSWLLFLTRLAATMRRVVLR